MISRPSRVANRSVDEVEIPCAFASGSKSAVVLPSGTEPMLRIYSETMRPETTRRILEETSALVQKL